MACALADRCSTPPGSGEPTLQGGAWPHLDFTHGERVQLVSPPLFARICNGGLEDLLDQACRLARGERQDVKGIARGSPADGFCHLPCLARRCTHISSNRFSFHNRRSTLCEYVLSREVPRKEPPILTFRADFGVCRRDQSPSLSSHAPVYASRIPRSSTSLTSTIEHAWYVRYALGMFVWGQTHPTYGRPCSL
jgi:hypothetical protein